MLQPQILADSNVLTTVSLRTDLSETNYFMVCMAEFDRVYTRNHCKSAETVKCSLDLHCSQTRQESKHECVEVTRKPRRFSLVSSYKLLWRLIYCSIYIKYAGGSSLNVYPKKQPFGIKSHSMRIKYKAQCID